MQADEIEGNLSSKVNTGLNKSTENTQKDLALNQLKLQAIQEQVAAAQQLAGVEAGIVRSTLEQVLNIRAGINEAKRREQEIGAQIDAARQVGDETAASRLVGEQKVAAEQTKLALIQGATALRDAGAQLVRQLQDVRNSLQNLRENNLRFQTPEQRQQTLNTLRRQVQEEAERRGVRVTFRGTEAERIREMRAFVDFGRQESDLMNQANQLGEALNYATAPLITSNETLNQSVTSLATVVDALAAKAWNVQVNVDAAGNSTIYGDVVNTALSPQ
jgi:hypothetical protein